MKSEVIETGLASIDANPFRLLKDYPYVEGKLETLQRSYTDVGMWPGVIARKRGNRYEIAFGHHRIEAAKRGKMKTVTLIVQDLDDKQMLQYMGRENMEDYNTSFLILLETWEAGIKFAEIAISETAKPIEIARLLGWIRVQSGSESPLTPAARACHAAHSLISGGYLTRDDLRDLSVKSAHEIVSRAQARMEQLEVLGKKGNRPKQDIETAKKQVGKAAKIVARDFRKGVTAQKDLRTQVDLETYRSAADSKRKSPLFAVFGNALADSIQKMLAKDGSAEKLNEIAKAVSKGVVGTEEDRKTIRLIDFALAELSEHRVPEWRKRIAAKHSKVIPFKLLKKEA